MWRARCCGAYARGESTPPRRSRWRRTSSPARTARRRWPAVDAARLEAAVAGDRGHARRAARRAVEGCCARARRRRRTSRGCSPATPSLTLSWLARWRSRWRSRWPAPTRRARACVCSCASRRWRRSPASPRRSRPRARPDVRAGRSPRRCRACGCCCCAPSRCVATTLALTGARARSRCPAWAGRRRPGCCPSLALTLASLALATYVAPADRVRAVGGLWLAARSRRASAPDDALAAFDGAGAARVRWRVDRRGRAGARPPPRPLDARRAR